MIMTLFSYKNGQNGRNRNRKQQKIGITVISSNQYRCKQSISIQNDKQNKLMLRSLSVERNNHKKQKLKNKLIETESNSQQMKKQGIRQYMMMSINQLSTEYDKLKLKRSNMTQRDSEISGNKIKLNQYESNSEIKVNYLINQNLLRSKCVPKSKINLVCHNRCREHKDCQGKQNKGMGNEQSKISYNNVRLKYFKERRMNNNSESTLRIEDTNDCSSNLESISVGLNLTLSKGNCIIYQGKLEKKFNEVGGCQCLIGQSRKKKGINVISRKKSMSESVSNESVSLFISKQIQKEREVEPNFNNAIGGKEGQSQISKKFGHYSQQYMRKSAEAKILG